MACAGDTQGSGRHDTRCHGHSTHAHERVYLLSVRDDPPLAELPPPPLLRRPASSYGTQGRGVGAAGGGQRTPGAKFYAVLPSSI